MNASERDTRGVGHCVLHVNRWIAGESFPHHVIEYLQAILIQMVLNVATTLSEIIKTGVPLSLTIYILYAYARSPVRIHI